MISQYLLKNVTDPDNCLGEYFWKKKQYEEIGVICMHGILSKLRRTSTPYELVIKWEECEEANNSDGCLEFKK